jgi:hypothetical protein
MGYRVWNVYEVTEGRNKGNTAYPGPAQFAKMCEWAEQHAPNRWRATMGFMEFDRKEDADAYREVFGESHYEV